jgi:hypothetical protein
MVNCLNVKKYILSIVSEKFSVSVSQEVSETKLKSRDLSQLDLVLINQQRKRSPHQMDNVNAKKR